MANSIKKDTREKGVAALESKRIGSRAGDMAHADTPLLAVNQLP
jgi:hypothetical protein